MLETIAEIVKANKFNDLKGKLLCKVPLSIPVFNFLLDKSIEDSSAIEKIEIVKIYEDEITLNVVLGSIKIAGKRFDMIDRKLLIKIHPILKPPEFEVQIEVLDGIKRIEEEILEALFNSAFQNDTFDFEDRTMLIKHSELFDHPVYQDLLTHIKEARLETQKDKLIYHLQLNFE